MGSGRGGTRSSGIDEDALKASGIHFPGKDQRSLEEGGRDYVMVKLGETIQPMKESFIVAHLAWKGAKKEDLVVPKAIQEYREKHHIVVEDGPEQDSTQENQKESDSAPKEQESNTKGEEKASCENGISKNDVSEETDIKSENSDMKDSEKSKDIEKSFDKSEIEKPESEKPESEKPESEKSDSEKSDSEKAKTIETVKEEPPPEADHKTEDTEKSDPDGTKVSVKTEDVEMNGNAESKDVSMTDAETTSNAKVEEENSGKEEEEGDKSENKAENESTEEDKDTNHTDDSEGNS